MFIKKLLVICLTTLSLPAFAQYHFVKSEEGVSEFKLDNGLKVILAPNKNSNQVFMSTTYLTGSLNDPQGKSGLAHLLEHLAFKGTKDVDEKSFLQRLQKNTLYQNAYTTFDRTSYINRIQPNQQSIDEIIYLEAQRMNALNLKIENVPTEIEIVRREREGRLDNPFILLIEKVYKTVYGNQFYGRSLIGDLNDLKSITQQDLDHFYQTWYAPNNAVIVLTGNFDPTQVIQTIDRNFASLNRKVLPTVQPVPKIDFNALLKNKSQDIVIEKGSYYVKNNIYMSNDVSQQNLLSAIPLLFTIKPTGILYKNIEEKGIATDVGMNLQASNDINSVFVNAVYSPNQSEKKVTKALIENVEQPAHFSSSDLDRIKSVLKNGFKTNELNPESLNGTLQAYEVQRKDWQLYFKDKKEVAAWTPQDVNTLVNQFFIPEHRISALIKPSVQVEKSPTQNQPSLETETRTEISSNLSDNTLKTPQEYAEETQKNIVESKEKLKEIESKIQRGELTKGIKYAFYPTTTYDQKVYASIDMYFGTPESLKDQQTNLEILANLLYKGSKNITQQQIMDQSIALDGQSSVNVIGNGLRILIVANQDHFVEYFKYLLNVLKSPSFPQSEFNLIQQQALSALNRPYTEPNVVAGLTMSRLAENYQPSDLRYHFEPELQKKRLQAATRNDIVKLYQKFFAFDHADIAITGNYQPEAVKSILQDNLISWKKQQAYELMPNQYAVLSAQQLHVKSEKTESGSYIGMMQLPVGAYDQDTEALLLIREILSGSQQTSRLTKALRENKQLVYGSTTNLSLDPYSHTGLFQVNAQYKSGYSTEITKTVHDVLSELVAHGVTERELELAKLKIIKSRNNSVDDSRRIHRMLNSQLELNQNMTNRIERERKMASLTKAEIDAVIKKYIKLDQYVEVSADEYGKTKTS